MRGRWFARLFFAVIAAFAVAGVMAGTACTRWGQPGPTVPMVGLISKLFVDPNMGSDTSGNGSQTNPYKTLTKAVEVLTSAKNLSPMGVSITLANGDYNAANGEKFPIVIPTNVSLTGLSFGMGVKSGAFINGLGEDTIFENLVHAPRRSAYATLEIVAATRECERHLRRRIHAFASGVARNLRRARQFGHDDRIDLELRCGDHLGAAERRRRSRRWRFVYVPLLSDTRSRVWDWRAYRADCHGFAKRYHTHGCFGSLGW